MLARAVRPKLTLTVPTVTSPTVFSHAPKSPFPTSTTSSSSSNLLSPSAISPSCTSPTARNTALNSRRHFATASASLAPPTPAAPSQKGGILKKAGCVCNHTASSGRVQGKKISFSKEASVTVVSPMPGDYHGDYVRMRGEGRWSRE